MARAGCCSIDSRESKFTLKRSGNVEGLRCFDCRGRSSASEIDLNEHCGLIIALESLNSLILASGDHRLVVPRYMSWVAAGPNNVQWVKPVMLK